MYTNVQDDMYIYMIYVYICENKCICIHMFTYIYMYLNVNVILYVCIYIYNPANPEAHEAYMSKLTGTLTSPPPLGMVLGAPNLIRGPWAPDFPDFWPHPNHVGALHPSVSYPLKYCFIKMVRLVTVLPPHWRQFLHLSLWKTPLLIAILRFCIVHIF
jgi:hypothetical protein